MWNFISVGQKIISLLVLTSLGALLISCGTSSATNSELPSQRTATSNVAITRQAASTPTAEQTTGVAKSQPINPSLADLLAPNKNNISTDTNGLHIQENGGFHCAEDFSTTVNLVLASDQLTYDQGQMQQLIQYIRSASVNSDAHSSLISSSLRWVEGASASQQPSSGTGSCSATFQLTNTGSTIIQIPRMALHIKEKPIPNTFAYRLIDVCPLYPSGQCPGMGGVPGYCGGYSINLFLGGAKLNDEIGDQPSAGNDANNTPCPELTLAPQKSTTLQISVAGPAFIYSVVPELTVITAQGQKVITLPSFASNLAFSNQFSCYMVKGNSFVNVQGEPEPNQARHCI